MGVNRLFPILIYPKYLMFETHDFIIDWAKFDLSKYNYKKIVLREVQSDMGNMKLLRYQFEDEDEFALLMFEFEKNNINFRVM